MTKNKFIISLLLMLVFGLACFAQDAPPPLPEMPDIPSESRYMVVINGNPAGPYDMAALQQMASNGSLTAASLVWKEGMSKWTPAGDVTELSDIFVRQNVNNQNDNVGYDRYDYEKEEAQHKFKKNLAAGIVCAALGSTLLAPGIVMIYWGTAFVTASSVLADYYGTYNYTTSSIVGGSIMLAWGAIFTIAHFVLTPLCAAGFSKAGRIAKAYRQRTGQRLAFFDRTSIGGGYDWEKKEVTVAMAIKL